MAADPTRRAVVAPVLMAPAGPRLEGPGSSLIGRADHPVVHVAWHRPPHWQDIGKRPVFVAGNSDGDLAMLQWASAGNGALSRLNVHHTDAARA